MHHGATVKAPSSRPTPKTSARNWPPRNEGFPKPSTLRSGLAQVTLTSVSPHFSRASPVRPCFWSARAIIATSSVAPLRTSAAPRTTTSSRVNSLPNG